MTASVVRRLRVFAGPNGSGKSTIIRELAKEWSPARGVFRLNHYLNADDIERGMLSTGLDLSRFAVKTTFAQICEALLQGGRLDSEHRFFREGRLDGFVLKAPRGNGYLAAAIVDFLREELLQRDESFSFETVMSHASKVEFLQKAQEAGYKTYLYFVCTNSADLNVARVRSRVGEGGHDVPEDKIRERYERSLNLAKDAVSHSYRAYFFDNSGSEPVWLAEFDPHQNCRLMEPRSQLPGWFKSVFPNY